MTVIVESAEGLWVLGDIGLGDIGKARGQESGGNTGSCYGCNLVECRMRSVLLVGFYGRRCWVQAQVPGGLGGHGEPTEALGHSWHI